MKYTKLQQKTVSMQEADQILFTKDELARADKLYFQRRKQWRDEVQKEMARSIKEERVKSGITQKELAQALKTSRTNIVSMESGRRNITINTLNKIAKAMGKELVIRFE